MAARLSWLRAGAGFLLAAGWHALAASSCSSSDDTGTAGPGLGATTGSGGDSSAGKGGKPGGGSGGGIIVPDTGGPDLDTDGDGIKDSQDGTGDDDGDGIPNYKDPINDGEPGAITLTKISTTFNS